MAKKRTINIRHVYKRILILCEGKKTEPLYFNQLKRHLQSHLKAVQIEIDKNEYTSAVELIKRAKLLRDKAKSDKNSYERVWVVYDKDGYTQHDAAYQLAKTQRIDIAFSSICFEFWYFLHFTYSTAPHQNADELVNKLKNYISDYDKSIGYFDQIREKLPFAIENARKVKEYCQIGYPDTRFYDLNPYTNVDDLIKYLYEIANSVIC